MSDFIYNQTKIPKEQWRYGLRSSADTGCGWIAVYNALKLMGYDEDPKNLTRYFQNRLPGINGTFGTFLPDLIAFFKKRGFTVNVIKRQSSFDGAVRASDACILFYWWRQGRHLGNHYVALTWRDGAVMGYNTYRNSVTVDRYGISLDAFLRKRGFFWPVLIAIRDKKSGNAGERRNCMMFRELSRIKQKLSDAECVEILKAEPRGVLSVLGDDGYPYGMPMNHWYCEENGHIYFHSGLKGHKVDAVRAHEKVSFCVYDQGYRREGEWALNIKSVIVFGRIRVVENQQEAMEIIRRLSYKYTSDSAYIEHEIQSAGARTLCLELIPEHVCGKLVNES